MRTPRHWLGGLVIGAAACSDPPTPAPRNPAAPETPAPLATPLPDRDPALAHRLVEDHHALLLDVRTAEEYATGHIEGAHNIPHQDVGPRIDEVERWVRSDRHAPIVVYCRSGRRSAIAKQTLMTHGFTQVTNLGGMDDW